MAKKNTPEQERLLAEAIDAGRMTVLPPGENGEHLKYLQEQARRQSNGRLASKGQRGRAPRGKWENPTKAGGGWAKRAGVPAQKEGEPLEDTLLRSFGYKK